MTWSYREGAWGELCISLPHRSHLSEPYQVPGFFGQHMAWDHSCYELQREGQGFVRRTREQENKRTQMDRETP